LLVGIKPEKLYSVSCVGREVNPLGTIEKFGDLEKLEILVQKQLF